MEVNTLYVSISNRAEETLHAGPDAFAMNGTAGEPGKVNGWGFLVIHVAKPFAEVAEMAKAIRNTAW